MFICFHSTVTWLLRAALMQWTSLCNICVNGASVCACVCVCVTLFNTAYALAFFKRCVCVYVVCAHVLRVSSISLIVHHLYSHHRLFRLTFRKLIDMVESKRNANRIRGGVLINHLEEKWRALAGPDFVYTVVNRSTNKWEP